MIINRLFKANKEKSDLFLTGMVDSYLLTISVATGILTARLLLPEGRGELAIIILWASVISSVGSLGIRDALVYEQAKGTTPKPTLLGNTLILATTQSILLMMVGWFLLPLLIHSQNPQVLPTAKIFLLFIPLNLLSLYCHGLLRGSLHLKAYNLTRMIVNTIYILGLLIYSRLSPLTSASTALILLSANFINAFMAFIVSWRIYGIRLRVSFSLIKRLFSYGWRIHIGTLSGLLNERLDQMLMAVFLTPKELGWYIVAVSVSSLTRIISSTFSQVIFPKMSNGDSIVRKSILKRYSWMTFALTLALVVAIIPLMKFLISIVYGSEYFPSVFPAQILSVAVVFLSMANLWRSALAGAGYPWVTSKAELISLVLTVIGLAIFIPYAGIVGAACVSLVAYLVSMLYLLKNLPFAYKQETHNECSSSIECSMSSN